MDMVLETLVCLEIRSLRHKQQIPTEGTMGLFLLPKSTSLRSFACVNSQKISIKKIKTNMGCFYPTNEQQDLFHSSTAG